MGSTQTVFVTGASGFIAKHIVRQLLDAGYRVRGSVRSARRAGEVADAVRPHLADASDLDSRLSCVELDLDRDTGWDTAMDGADILVHTASPFPLEQPTDETAVIRPAVDGTLRALRAAKRAGIGRAVMTSSTAAIMNRDPGPGRTILDERDWSDLSDPRATPYVKSKTLAERAAWAFVADEAPDMQLTVINPGFVLGPPLDGALGTSLKVVERLLRGTDPMLPNFGFPTVDVRDIAAMHVEALTRPDTVGRRFIGGDQFLWFIDMAKILKATYPDRRISTRRAPNTIVRLLALFDRPIRTILPNLDREDRITCDRARETFGITFVDARDSLKASADFLVRSGAV